MRSKTTNLTHLGYPFRGMKFLRLGLRVALVSFVLGIFLVLSGCSDNSGGGGGGSSYTPYTYTPYTYTPYTYTPSTYTPSSYTYNSLCASATKPDGTKYQSNDEIQKAIEGVAHPLATDVAFYRWGNSDFELDRIRLSNSGDDIFDLQTVNTAGAAVAGSGLYLADSPTASVSYGRDVKPASKASIITVVLPKGALYLDGKDWADIDALKKIGFTPSDVEWCNPNVIFKYDANWWILKSPAFSGKKVKAEAFSGRYLKSAALAQSQEQLKGEINTNSGYVNLGALNENEVIDELEPRPVYNNDEVEPIPVPLKSLHTVLEWPSVAELRNLTPPNNPTRRTYRWTWSGECNLYERDVDGALVLVSRNQNDQQCRYSQPLVKRGVDSHFSKSFSSGCYEVVRHQPEVIVNKVHSNAYFCY